MMRMTRHALHYARNASGQITLSLALVALPLCLTIGSAIDYGMLMKTRSALQDALDSATLAAAAKSGMLDDATARSFFKKNSSLDAVTVNAINFTKNADGTVTGHLTATVPAIFMRIVRTRDYTIRTQSSAKGVFPTKLTSASLTIVDAKGAYDKEIYFYTKNAAGTITSKTLALSYDYTYVPSTGGWSKRWTPRRGTSYTVTVGPYDSYGVMMVAYADRSLTGQKTNPDVMTTQDADVATFLKTTGNCADPAGQTLNWEDSRDPRDDYTDFVATMRCALVKTGPPTVRLTN